MTVGSSVYQLIHDEECDSARRPEVKHISDPFELNLDKVSLCSSPASSRHNTPSAKDNPLYDNANFPAVRSLSPLKRKRVPTAPKAMLLPEPMIPLAPRGTTADAMNLASPRALLEARSFAIDSLRQPNQREREVLRYIPHDLMCQLARFGSGCVKECPHFGTSLDYGDERGRTRSRQSTGSLMMDPRGSVRSAKGESGMRGRVRYSHSKPAYLGRYRVG